MLLSERVRFLESPMYDFFYSIYRFKNQKNFELIKDEYIIEKYEYLNSIMPSEIKKIMDKYFSQDMEGILSYFLKLITDRNINSTEALSDTVKKIDSEKISFDIIKELIENEFNEDNFRQIKNDTESMVDFIVENTELSNESKWILIEMISKPEKVKSELVSFIDWYGENFFNKIIDKVNETIEDYKLKINTKLSEEGESYLKRITKSEVLGEKEIYYIGISYFYQCWSGYIRNKEKDVYILGYHFIDEMENEINHIAYTSNFLKIIGDETRLKIIKLISEKSMTGAEISRRLGISTATISYHMGALASFYIVQIREEGRKIYYSLDTKVFKEFLIKSFDNIFNSETNF